MKQSKYDIENGSEAAIEPNMQTEEVYEIGSPVEKVNNVQVNETYSLTSISTAPEVTEAAPEVVTLAKVDLSEHKTGHAINVIGGQLDIAIDRFHAVQEDDSTFAKLDLLARLRTLEHEAETFVRAKIEAIRDALKG